MKRTRIWCETVPIETLATSRVTALLARYAIDPIVAVRPGDETGVRSVVGELWAAGLRPALWPMLADRDGRWGSAWNVDRFCAWVRTAVDRAGRSCGTPLEVALDLEPPFDVVAAAVADRSWAPWKRSTAPGAAAGRSRPRMVGRAWGMQATAEALRGLVLELRESGVKSFAAVAPMVMWDRAPDRLGDKARAAGGWPTVAE